MGLSLASTSLCAGSSSLQVHYTDVSRESGLKSLVRTELLSGIRQHCFSGLGSEIPQRNLPSKSSSPASVLLYPILAALGSRSPPLPSKSQSSIFPESWLLPWFLCPVSPRLPLPRHSSPIGGLHLHGWHGVRQVEVQKSLNSFKAAISGSSCFLAYAELHDAPASFLFLTPQAVPQVSRAALCLLCLLTQSSLPGSPFTSRFSLPSLVPCLLSPPGSFLVSLLRQVWFSLSSPFSLSQFDIHTQLAPSLLR